MAAKGFLGVPVRADQFTSLGSQEGHARWVRSARSLHPVFICNWVRVWVWVWVCVQGRAGGARAGGAQRVQPCIHIWGGWACVQGRQEGVRGGCVLRVGAVQEGRARWVRSACGLQCSVLPVQVSVGAL